MTERRAGRVKRATRYDHAAAVTIGYQQSSRQQKGWILDEFCAATGYNRKYAIEILCGPFPRAALPSGDGRPAGGRARGRGGAADVLGDRRPGV